MGSLNLSLQRRGDGVTQILQRAEQDATLEILLGDQTDYWADGHALAGHILCNGSTG
jgi:hypothetical protein